MYPNDDERRAMLLLLQENEEEEDEQEDAEDLRCLVVCETRVVDHEPTDGPFFSFTRKWCKYLSGKDGNFFRCFPVDSDPGRFYFQTFFAISSDSVHLVRAITRFIASLDVSSSDSFFNIDPTEIRLFTHQTLSTEYELVCGLTVYLDLEWIAHQHLTKCRHALDVANEAVLQGQNNTLFGNNFSRIPWHESWWATDAAFEPTADAIAQSPEIIGPIIDPNNQVGVCLKFTIKLFFNHAHVHSTLVRIGPVTSPAVTPVNGGDPGWDKAEEEDDRSIRDIILRSTYIPGYHNLLFEGKVAETDKNSEEKADFLTLTSDELSSLIGMEFAVCYEQEAHFYVWLMGSGPEGIIEDVKKLNPHGRVPFTAPYRSGVMLHNSFHVCTSTGLETFALQSARPILRQYLRSIFPRLGHIHFPDSGVSDAPQAVTRLRPAGVPPPGPGAFLG
ncbi:unnamed protein product [Notodromas monacha]|uniref:Uncharacterized protein n=1 Tax=Notodromas monacha TaxID=399045 RepID=A0A7R9BDE2_9CRUS|nr:unnamed protein product [Notodromas monacha]CAG0913269.1 unnamed protein product [Notodromas monacha]